MIIRKSTATENWDHGDRKEDGTGEGRRVGKNTKFNKNN